MADRQAAARGVEPIAREGTKGFRIHAGLVPQEGRALQRLDVGQHLGREGFVDLPKVDVFIAQAVARQQARNGIGRCHQQAFVVQVDGGDLPIDQARTWRAGRQPAQALFRGHPEARRAIGQRR